MNSIADAGERPVNLSDLWIRMARGAVGRGNERVFLAGCGCQTVSVRCPATFPPKCGDALPKKACQGFVCLTAANASPSGTFTVKSFRVRQLVLWERSWPTPAARIRPIEQ